MLVITGMHRSGTSFVANMVQKIGAPFGPDDLLGGDQWNPRGYFENIDVIDLNNRLIVGESAGLKGLVDGGRLGFGQRLKRTLGKARYALFPGGGDMAAKGAAHADEMDGLARRLAGCAVKDVRFSLTLPAWQGRGAVERILYCYRHPTEVAGSLAKRDRLPLWLSYRLWRIHVERFLDAVGETPVVCVDYNNFFDDTRRIDETLRLFRFAGQEASREKAEALLAQVIDPSLRHNRADGALPGATRACYHRLEEFHERHDGRP
ncbi:MAG: hypothetical protein HQK87_05250 [Nitrospinae bacterium]|nr:hypothetical protein [Nitrospinota bacterium]